MPFICSKFTDPRVDSLIVVSLLVTVSKLNSGIPRYHTEPVIVGYPDLPGIVVKNVGLCLFVGDLRLEGYILSEAVNEIVK